MPAVVRRVGTPPRDRSSRWGASAAESSVVDPNRTLAVTASSWTLTNVNACRLARRMMHFGGMEGERLVGVVGVSAPALHLPGKKWDNLVQGGRVVASRNSDEHLQR